MQQFGWNLFPMRIASGSYRVTEHVSWLLSHAQVADDKPVIIDTGTDEILRKPAQAVYRPDVACVSHCIGCRWVRGKLHRAFIDHQRIEAFEITVVGYNDRAPQQRIEWRRRQEYRRIL